MNDQQFGIVRSYEDMIRAFRARIEHLGITYEQVDDLGFFPLRHTSKLLAPRYTRCFGPVSFPAMCAAVGMMFVAVEDKQAMKKIAPRITLRLAPAHMLAVDACRGKRMISKRFLSFIARRGALARLRKLSPARRTWIARNAAQARWRRAAQPIV
jgi:hypothetical protein